MNHYHLCNASEQSFSLAPQVFPQKAPQLAAQIDRSDKSEVFLKRHNLHPCSPFIHLPFIRALTTSAVPKHWDGSQVLIKRIRGTPDASVTKGDSVNSGYFSRWAKEKKTLSRLLVNNHGDHRSGMWSYCIARQVVLTRIFHRKIVLAFFVKF